jgi:hypothetical protein
MKMQQHIETNKRKEKANIHEAKHRYNNPDSRYSLA